MAALLNAVTSLWRRLTGRVPTPEEKMRFRREQFELVQMFQLEQRVLGKHRSSREKKAFMSIAMIDSSYRRRQALLDSFIDQGIIPHHRYRGYTSRPHFKQQLRRWLEAS